MTEPQQKLAPALGDMSKEDFRRFGHQLIDWVAEYLEHVEDLPVLAQIEPGDLKAQLPASPPEKGEAMEQILADIDRLIVPALTHWSHPSFFAYFATSIAAQNFLAKFLSATYNKRQILRQPPRPLTKVKKAT